MVLVITGLITLYTSAVPPTVKPELPVFLPRYQWDVGQKMVYETTSANWDGIGRGGRVVRNTFWVIQKNDDGSYRFLVHEAWSTMGEGAAAGVMFKPSFSFLRLIDRRTDGRWSWPGRAEASSTLPHLMMVWPTKADELATGWQYYDKSDDTTFRHHLVDNNETSSQLTIHIKHQSPMNEIYGYTIENVAHFDWDKGVIKSVESRTTSGRGIQSTSTRNIRLVSNKKMDDTSFEIFKSEVNDYLRVNARVEQLKREALSNSGKAERLLDQALDHLKKAASRCTVKVITDQLELELERWDDARKTTLDRAKVRAKFVGELAFDWELDGVDGKTYALSDFRGQVVLLDFWYRGCSWCIKAMPASERVTKHFAGRPIRVVGINIDKNIEDAKFVVEKLHLSALTLLGQGVPEAYSVNGYPTFIVIDQKGIIREVIVGYSGDLAKQLIAAIEPLLKEKD